MSETLNFATQPKTHRPALIQLVDKELWPYVKVAFGFTFVLNLIALVSPIYMLQVYDRVLVSESYETLTVLTLIAIFLLFIFIAADVGRKRVLAIGGQHLSQRLDRIVANLGLIHGSKTPNAMVENIGHLARMQSVLTSGSLVPLLDLPFAPLFIVVLFFIHPLLGTIGLVGALTLLTLAWYTDVSSREAVEEASLAEVEAGSIISHTAHQRAAIISMGIGDRAIDRWQQKRTISLEKNLKIANHINFLSATTRSIRQILQILILCGGAYISLSQGLSPGTIIAGSIIMGRGLVPIDQTVAVWRQVIKARQSREALSAFLENVSVEKETFTPMPRPKPILKFEEFSVATPGSDKPLLPKLSFELPQGAIVAVLGNSGCGKTSFLQSVAGAWQPAHGIVRLGGRDLHDWQAGDRGKYVGYLPQHVELLTGTVAENIARFTDASEVEIFSAAKRGGCHEVISSLPHGYDTKLGKGGINLSAGQRQAVGIARALFRDPALLLLDEPTAHLDTAMAIAMMENFTQLAKSEGDQRNAACLIATHDINLIKVADQVLLIKDRQVALMSRAEYFSKISDLNNRRVKIATGKEEVSS